jgi:hypothetical protein
MTAGLFRKALAYWSDRGFVRTVGATARYCAERFEERCETVGQMLDWDRGRGYPLATRLRAARLGLSAHAYLWLGLDDPGADPDRYLKSVDPIRRLNHRHIVPLHNKYTFQSMTGPYLPAVPELYGIVDEGVFRPCETTENDLLAVLEQVGQLVLKPARGGKGTGVHFLERTEAGLTLNGDRVTQSTIRDRLAGLDEYLVTEFVHQHDYAATIFPDATNTLRIYSVFDRRDDRAEVFRAVHRFGSEASAPTDNWSRGGYCVPVDVETGRMRRLLLVDGPTRSALERHPATDATVEGVTVPHWDAVRELVREAATLHRYAPLVGWDIVVTADGPVLIEANARPSKELLQLEQGVLDDPTFQALFDREWPSTVGDPTAGVEASSDTDY